MKELELKEVIIDLQGEQNIKLSQKDWVMAAIDSVPQGGLNISEIRKRNRVAKAVESMEDNILKLEDQDAATLKECVLEMSWRIRHELIDEFVSKIENL